MASRWRQTIPEIGMAFSSWRFAARWLTFATADYVVQDNASPGFWLHVRVPAPGQVPVVLTANMVNPLFPVFPFGIPNVVTD